MSSAHGSQIKIEDLAIDLWHGQGDPGGPRLYGAMRRALVAEVCGRINKEKGPVGLCVCGSFYDACDRRVAGPPCWRWKIAPGEPGPEVVLPPTDLLEARSAKRYNQPQIIGAPSKAYDEDNYSVGRLRRRPRSLYDERFDIEEKRRLAANRAAVRARLAEVVHGNAFFSMRQKLTKRKLRAKALRLAAKHAVGGKGTGDSDAIWQKRLQSSEVVETVGDWEKRHTLSRATASTTTRTSSPSRPDCGGTRRGTSGRSRVNVWRRRIE